MDRQEGRPNTLGEYLAHKHVEYCNRIGRVVSEAVWVADLNRRLLELTGDRDNRLSAATMNQWIRDNREPAGDNIKYLIMLFGWDVAPYLGLPVPGDDDLKYIIMNWGAVDEAAKEEIRRITQSAAKKERRINIPVTA